MLYQFENIGQLITIGAIIIGVLILVVILRIVAFFVDRMGDKKMAKEKKFKDQFKGLPSPEKAFEEATLAKPELPVFTQAEVQPVRANPLTNTVFCTECGWRGDPEDDVFCGNCGAPLFKGAKSN